MTRWAATRAGQRDHGLEHRGLDRVRAFGADGFARVVALSIVAFNIHRIGLLLRRKTRRRRAA